MKLFPLKAKLFIFLIIFLSYFQKITAQQDIQFTQYMHNTFVVNPAFAGSLDQTVITAVGRSQWLGTKGAPNTQTLSFHSPMPNVTDMGIGLNLINDAIGPLNEIYADASMSYAIHLKNETRLAFGLKLGGRYFSVDANELNLDNPNDPKANQNINKLFATVGAGLYFNAERYYIGVSSPNLIPNKIYSGSKDTGSVAKERYHIYTMAGYIFDINHYIKFKPSALAKKVLGAPVSIDISANFLFNEKLHAGLAFRLKDNISFLGGYQITDNLFFGYAYDLTSSEFRVTNNGSHEIVLKYKGEQKPKRFKCSGGGLTWF